MLFHTWPFLLFFLIVYPIYLALRGTRFRIPFLLAVSYFFYACFNPLYLIVLFYSTLFDYIVVAAMAKSRRKKGWLLASILNNLVLLVFFKYAGLIIEDLNIFLSAQGISYVVPSPDVFLSACISSLNGLLSSLGVNYAFPMLDGILPVGISFYILQSMSYTIDFYRGKIEREKSFIRYATYIAFFPRIVAGPIERAGNLLPQLRKTPKVSTQDFADGLSLFIVGLFKKVALADYLALYVDKVYATPQQFQSPALILATFLFCWQIYFDFSGYTDMARGLARMIGLRLMLNFNNPYLATGLGEFWSRWHISLSSWFKDYVYIPLGGNRRGRFNTYKNMFLTMLISGLWHAGLYHGAAGTFVIWGAVHALGRFCTRELEKTSFYKNKVPKLAKQLFVFVFVGFAWIFFRAESISDAWVIVTRIFTSDLANPYCPLFALTLIFSVWLYQFIYESKIKRVLDLRPVRIAIVLSMIFYIAVFTSSTEKAFIYSQF